MTEAEKQGLSDQSSLIRKLDSRQRKVLQLFVEFETITSRQIGDLFGFKPRTSLNISWNHKKNREIFLLNCYNIAT